MTTTEKIIRANRANAQKSTGPKTKEGKKISGRNAVKHGLYTNDLIIKSPALTEDEEEYERMFAALTDELQPEGVFQEYLVRTIANCLWRSARVVRAETAQINRQLHFMSDTLPRAIAVGVDSIPKGDAASHILRYEMRVDRQLSRALNLLMRLKKSQLSQDVEKEIVGPPKNEETNPFSSAPDDDISLPGN
jgi:hypothetical protein